MHVLLLEPSYYTKYPPLGLLKISAWHKKQGDTVQFIRGVERLHTLFRAPQRIYVTSLFTWAWHPVHEAVHMCKMYFPKTEIRLGGIYASLMPKNAKKSGADLVYRGLLEECECLLPDYSIVPEWHRQQKASVLFTHRGCIRRCKYCAVPRLEGKPKQFFHGSIRELIHPDHTKVILWDNNILGLSNWRDVIEELKDLNLEVDFNQGIDARLITEEVAECLRGMRMPTIRIAYDSIKDSRKIKKGIDNLEHVGFRKRSIFSYVLFNFKDSPEDLLTRVRNLFDWGVQAYPMRFQPFDALEKDNYVSELWTAEQLEMVATARRVIGYGGTFPPYEGLRKKFAKAINFEEAFSLWQTKGSRRRGQRSEIADGLE